MIMLLLHKMIVFFLLAILQSDNLISYENIQINDSDATLYTILKNNFFIFYIYYNFRVLNMNSDSLLKVIRIGYVCSQTNMKM